MMAVAQEASAALGWHPHPEVWLLVMGMLIGYVWAVTVLGPRRAPAGIAIATTGQKVAFLLGAVALLIAEDWPLHELAEEYWFSAHMVQHLLFAFVIPPLLLLGIPPWLLRTLLGKGARFTAFRFLTRPVIALVLFNGAIIAMHWPVLVDLQSNNGFFHLFFHMVLLGAALVMWAVVVAPLPELNRLSDPAKMLYLFLQSVVPTVPASFLTFAEQPLYSFYESAPRLWGLSAGTDQMMAGLLMKLGGGLLLWSVIAVMFFRWSAKEEAQVDHEVSWDDFERELEVWNMRKT
jgi:putative membrane protein